MAAGQSGLVVVDPLVLPRSSSRRIVFFFPLFSFVVLFFLVFFSLPMLSNVLATPTLEQLPNCQPFSNGTNATFQLSNPNSNFSLLSPYYLTIDPISSDIYVTEIYNSKVVRYKSNTLTNRQESPKKSKRHTIVSHFLFPPRNTTTKTKTFLISSFAQFDLVLGGAMYPPNQTSLYWPQDLYIDAGDRLWIADTQNNRVLRFDNVSSFLPTLAPYQYNASALIGQQNYTTSNCQSAQCLSWPTSVAFDDTHGRLWVVDTRNNRVLWFDSVIAVLSANGNIILASQASGVLGAPNLTTLPGPSCTRRTFGSTPGDLRLDQVREVQRAPIFSFSSLSLIAHNTVRISFLIPSFLLF